MLKWLKLLRRGSHIKGLERRGGDGLWISTLQKVKVLAFLPPPIQLYFAHMRLALLPYNISKQEPLAAFWWLSTCRTVYKLPPKPKQILPSEALLSQNFLACGAPRPACTLSLRTQAFHM